MTGYKIISFDFSTSDNLTWYKGFTFHQYFEYIDSDPQIYFPNNDCMYFYNSRQEVS